MTTFHSLRLKKYVLNNTFPDIVARGRKMLTEKLCTIDSLDPVGPGKAVFKVRSDSEDKIYRVEISGFKAGTLKSSCTCPYDWGGICKHRVAAIHLLDTKLQQEESGPAKIVFQMLDSTAFLPALGDAALRVNCRDDDWKAVAKLPERVVVKQAMDGFAECELTYKKTPYTIRLTGREKDMVHTSCTCNESLLYPLCLHKVAALLKIREQFGANAFAMMRDWTDDKRRLLAEYGYTLEDDLKGKFDFRVNDRKGELELVLKDASLHKLDADWQGLGLSLLGGGNGTVAAPVVAKAEETIQLIYALECAGPLGLPGLKLTPLTCKINPKTGKMTHVRQLSQLQGGSLPVVSPEDTRNIRLGGQLTVEGLIKHLQEADQLPKYGWYGYDFEAKLSEEARAEARRYEGALLEELFNGMAGKKTYEQARSTYSYSAETLSPVTLSPVRLKPEFVVKEETDLVSVEMSIRVDGKPVPFAQFGYRSFWVVYYLGTFYKFAGLAEANLFRYFSEHGAVRVKKDRLPEFLAGFVLPLAGQCDIDLKLSQPVREAALQFAGHRLYLKEDEENLLLVPATAYAADGEAVECAPDGRQYRFTETGGQVTRWRRDAVREGEGYDLVKALHPDFERQAGRPSFAVPFADVLKENWLFKTVEQLQAHGVEVLGQSTLKKIRYNLNRPTFQMRTSSGIDWFDVKVEIRFGDQLASLADVRKALLKKENFVTLGDGTLGMLPAEWLDKYAGMLRVGQVDGDTVKVSKLHFSVIDALYNEIDSLEVQRELYEKRQKLLHFQEIADVPLPANVKAQLRDYQREGFKWLHFLNEFGWGGCLADDMGLGKTLQVLTFLQERQNRTPDATNLVVVPTSLLSNWESEAAKFCPDLKTQVYRGAARQWDIDLFDEFDLVITTYGTVRSDIEKLRKYRFHYVVLDESQAIKNPSSQVAKAVKLLKADNRIVMTGTPVENNTFDLYSQMDFLNPGLLGSEAFFRLEYATPIDKHRNEEKARELRGLIYPFMLKRTKEEVAKDLPDKTEIVLHCEMGKAQR